MRELKFRAFDDIKKKLFLDLAVIIGNIHENPELMNG
jgi:hypothetical protein